MSTNIGQVSPRVLDFSGAVGYGHLINRYVAASFFTLTTPDFLSTVRIATLTFTVYGADAWQIDPGFPPQVNVTLIPTNMTNVGAFLALPGTFPASVLINSTTRNMNVQPTPFGVPDINNTLTIGLACTAGSIFPPTLTFDSVNWHRNQSFAYTAPSYIVNVTCVFSLTGFNLNNQNNPHQYTLPKPFRVTVLGIVTLVVSDSGSRVNVTFAVRCPAENHVPRSAANRKSPSP